MNTCHNCNHEFEFQPGSIQVCPLCGETVDLSLDASKSDELDFDSLDDEVDDDLDDNEIFELEAEEPDDSEDTVHGTLYDPSAELPGDDLHRDENDIETEDLDSLPFALTEQGTMESEGGDEDGGGSGEDVFDAENDPTIVSAEISDDNTQEVGAGTEVYEPDQKQPTIELENTKTTAASLDYAERQIVGLSMEDQNNADADYVISLGDEDSELGSGACGVVYKATQKSLDRTVAIKLLKKQIQAGTQSQQRRTTPKQRDVEKFLYESQITAGLDHPNVITVHDLGVTSNNTLFYSMKLFEGGKDWSKDFDKNTLEENLDIFNDVCDAMRRAHRDRIIHRDLKPQNVLVGDFGEVQVTDWGLALDLNGEEALTFSGGGTPCYMAPEMSSHYLAQQELQTLNKKLKWAQTNTPDSADEIAVLKEKIAENEEKESLFREKIGELSDVYVLGAILFQIASGYPPHLYQISDINRRQWGSATGKNKVLRELQMSAEGNVANYMVRDLANPEAREALRDIASQAMATDMADRFDDVGELQNAVRDFRDFMRCVEDTHRGEREVAEASEDQTSYVHLNNAIYAFEGALENYPDYAPANTGLAKARFLFAERALKNQDFELGLSTMTEAAIDHQPDKTLATRLRDELTTQRNRRDRRKKLLFVATMASLASIAVGVLMGVFAAAAGQRAIVAQQDAQAAQRDEIATKTQLKDELVSLKETHERSIESEVELGVAELTLSEVDQQKIVSKLETDVAKIERNIEKAEFEFSIKESELSQRRAQIEKQIAEVETIRAKIDSELIKENTQYDQYKNYLRDIERNIDEEIAQAKLTELFESRDVSLPVKNAWEAHHLYKQANPATAAIGQQKFGAVASLVASADGQTLVAISVDGGVYRATDGRGQFETLTSPRLRDAKVLSIDISSNGKWLAAAIEAVDDNMAKTKMALPVVIDLESGNEFEFSDKVYRDLQFVARKPGTKKICREKFYCRVQHLEFLAASDGGFSLFMVDQRAALGLNQFRCSVLDMKPQQRELVGAVRKAKLPGQLFRQNPGQLVESGCIASAVVSADGDVIAAVAGSHPGYGVAVVSIDAADKAFKNPANLKDPKFEVRYFEEIKSKQTLLDRISTDFAPTAMKLLQRDAGNVWLLIGNGKGELVNLELKTDSNDSIAMTAVKSNLMNPNSPATARSSQIVDAAGKRRLTIPQRPAEMLASTHSAAADSVPPAHNSVVRDIVSVDGRVVSISESEIMIWDVEESRLTATKRLYGHEGKIANVAATQEKQLAFYTAANLEGGMIELRRWLPESNAHDAMIELEDFKTAVRTSKRIVCGTADKQAGSHAAAFAFDDGTIEYFDPDQGTVTLGRPAEESLIPGENSVSQSDFNVGKFKLVADRPQLLMYSNSIGLMAWNLDDDEQTDPVSMQQATALFRGQPKNTAVYFSADQAGNNLVSSHPQYRDRFLLWQHTEDGNFSVTEMGPLKKSGTQSLTGINAQVQPAISPDGRTIACVLRLRNTYEVQIFAASPSRNPRKLGVYTGDSKTNFRSIHFLGNDEIVLTQDRVVQGVDRESSLVQLSSSGGRWTEQAFELPKSLSRNYGQISIADVADIDGERLYVGFGIQLGEDSKEKVEGCDVASGERHLIVWGQRGKILDRAIPFSRRISPRFVDGKLEYFVAGNRGTGGVIRIEDLADAEGERAVELKIDRARSVARRWQAVDDNQFVACGKDWLTLVKHDGKTTETEFVFSRNNPARSVEMAGQQLVVHHEDLSVSTINTADRKVRRLKGFHRSVALAASGKLLAVVDKNKGKVVISNPADEAADAVDFECQAACMIWMNRDSLLPFAADKAQWPDDVLVTAALIDSAIELSFWSPAGKSLATSKEYSRLPLRRKHDGQSVKSFSLSATTGKLASIIWETAGDDGAEIWRYSRNGATKKQAEGDKDEFAWFLVDSSKLGKIESVSFSEVSTDDANDEAIAPRIVISNNNQGAKSIGLYALGLGVDFQAKPLLDLYVTNKLQNVDEIVGASFSGDGKTLLAMTSERAQLRLSDGWNAKKEDAEYKNRINEFNVSYKAANNSDLQSQLQAADGKLNSLKPPASLAEEEEKQRKANDDLAKAMADLVKLQAGLERQKQLIRNKATAAVQVTIAGIDGKIKKITDELSAAKQ